MFIVYFSTKKNEDVFNALQFIFRIFPDSEHRHLYHQGRTRRKNWERDIFSPILAFKCVGVNSLALVLV